MRFAWGKTNIPNVAPPLQNELGACSLHPGWVGGGQLLTDSTPHLRRKHVDEGLGLWEDEAQGHLLLGLWRAWTAVVTSFSSWRDRPS